MNDLSIHCTRYFLEPANRWVATVSQYPEASADEYYSSSVEVADEATASAVIKRWQFLGRVRARDGWSYAAAAALHELRGYDPSALWETAVSFSEC